MLRVPARSNNASSFWWAFAFGVYIWLGGVAIGWSHAVSFVLAVVAGFAIFAYVRIYGEDEPRRP